MKKEIKSIIRKYTFKVLIIAIIFLLTISSIIYFAKLNFILSFIVCFVLYIPVYILIFKIADKNIHSVLFVELDPEKYKDVLFFGRFKPHAINQTNAAMFLGDYQTVVNLSTKVLKGKVSKRNKCALLATIARAYYEMGDLEKLKIVCDTFDLYADGLKKTLSEQKIGMIMRYYKYFIDEKYEACNAVLDEMDAIRNNKSANEKLSRLYAIFNYGIIAYKLGNFDNAVKCFNQVVETAPKINDARIAEKYIDAINNSKPVDLGYSEIVPDENYIIPFYNQRKKSILVLRITALVFVLIFGFFQSAEYILKIDKNKKVEKAIIAVYGGYQSFEELRVPISKTTVLPMYVVIKNDGEFDLTCFVTYDNDDTKVLDIIFDDLYVGSYSWGPIGEDYIISFCLYENYADVPSDAICITELNNGHKTNYFAVTNIKQF